MMNKQQIIEHAERIIRQEAYQGRVKDFEKIKQNIANKVNETAELKKTNHNYNRLQ